MILIFSFCVYVSTLHIFLLCIFSYSGLILVLTCSLFCPYSNIRKNMRKIHTIWYVIILCPKWYNFIPKHWHFIPARIIPYLQLSVHTSKVLIHTHTCHFIPATVCFIRKGVNSSLHMLLYASAVHTKTCHFMPATTCFIRIRNVSYVQILFHTFEILFHIYWYCFIRAHVISSNHTYRYCFIPKHVISYLRQPVSYVYVLFHTYTFRWNVCDQAHCTCVY